MAIHKNQAVRPNFQRTPAFPTKRLAINPNTDQITQNSVQQQNPLEPRYRQRS